VSAERISIGVASGVEKRTLHSIGSCRNVAVVQDDRQITASDIETYMRQKLLVA
jgi:hypothetical protein